MDMDWTSHAPGGSLPTPFVDFLPIATLDASIAMVAVAGASTNPTAPPLGPRQRSWRTGVVQRSRGIYPAYRQTGRLNDTWRHGTRSYQTDPSPPTNAPSIGLGSPFRLGDPSNPR